MIFLCNVAITFVWSGYIMNYNSATKSHEIIRCRIYLSYYAQNENNNFKIDKYFNIFIH